MATRTTAADRLWLWFAVCSVMLLGVLAISPLKDYFREYRRIQETYHALLLRSAGSMQELRRAEAQKVGIRQIWIPGFDDRVDRCPTCHLGIEDARMAKAEEPFTLHPRTPHSPKDFPGFGCVVCHQGQGRATSIAEAHGQAPDWDQPLLPVRYTEAACGRCHRTQVVPEASLLSAGRALMSRVGCYGCHRIAGYEGWQSTAPDLNGLSAKTNPAWLKAWLKSPRSLRPATWMPDFRLGDEEIDAVVAFLWAQPAPARPEPAGVPGPPGDAARGKVLFSESRCISCHTVEGKGNGSAPELSGIGSKVTRSWLVAFLGNPHAFQSETAMPRYAFGPREVADLSEYLMTEFTDPAAPAPAPASRSPQKLIEAGETLYRKYGCSGCHRIAGRKDVPQAGPELTGIGQKPAALLDFGARRDLPRRLPDWLAAKVSSPRSFREGLRMPEFGFTDEQVEALVTALLSLSNEPIPEKLVVRASRNRYAPPGRFGSLVTQYRCLSCHEMEGAGGDISTAALSREGSKVRRDWLAHYLITPTTLRPVLIERMIPLRMPQTEADFIADFIDNVYKDGSIPEEIFPTGPAPGQVERGRDLFYQRYGCQACHMIGGKGGYYGPVLDGAGSRLRSGWVYWWLKGPQRWRADVREPDYGLDDEDARDLAAWVVSIPAAATGSPGGGSMP